MVKVYILFIKEISVFHPVGGLVSTSSRIDNFCDFSGDNPSVGKISLNLWKAYLNFMSLTNDTQPGKVTLTKFAIIQGNALGTSDGIVTTIDEDSIYSNVQLKNLSSTKSSKQSFKVLAFHSNLDTRTISKTLIRKLLNNEELTFFEKTFNLLNESKT